MDRDSDTDSRIFVMATWYQILHTRYKLTVPIIISKLLLSFWCMLVMLICGGKS
jgi:hypothetical protein